MDKAEQSCTSAEPFLFAKKKSESESPSMYTGFHVLPPQEIPCFIGKVKGTRLQKKKTTTRTYCCEKLHCNHGSHRSKVAQRRGFDYLIWHCAVLIEGSSHGVCRYGNLGSKRHTDQNVIAKELFGKALKLHDSLVFS